MQTQKYDDNTEKELRDPQIIPAVIDILPDSDSFRDPKIRAVYRSIAKRDLANQPIDITLLMEDGHLGSLLMGVYDDDYCVGDNWKAHAEAIKLRGKKRWVLKVAKKLAKDVVTDKPLGDVIVEHETAIANMSMGDGDGGPRITPELTSSIIDDMNNYAAGIQPEGRLYTNIEQVDKIVRILPGNLIYIGGWSSQGKTQLGLQIAQWNAVKRGVKTLVFSLEMSGEELAERMMLAEADIALKDMLEGNMSADEMDRAIEAKATIDASPLQIYDDIYGLNEIKLAAKRAVKRDGVELIVVDYVQMITPPQGENRRIEVGGMSRDFKRLAAELHIPIIVLTQLTDLPSGVQKRRPVQADVAEAKSIKNDANALLLVWQDPNNRVNNTTYAEVIVAKQRNGPTGWALMNFVKGRWLERYLGEEN